MITDDTTQLHMWDGSLPQRALCAISYRVHAFELSPLKISKLLAV